MLFRRLAEGDEVAFRQIFHYYNKLLQPFAVKLTRSTQAAEEVLQEVFLKVWAHRSKLAEVDDPKAYIIRIVSNESINYMQASAKHRHLVIEMPQTLVMGLLRPNNLFLTGRRKNVCSRPSTSCRWLAGRYTG